ncbi:MAG: hypothetical protein N2595_08045, partial [bacterium]|nr:hypothetical protein [bacterium]
MMSEGDRELVAALHGCNQRGGRMLTVVDLVEAGSCDVSVAGYLCAVMRGGSSVLVGATPGGGGKTTVMCALLNFLPNETRVVVVEREGVLHELPERPTCVLAHEISSAPYYAYIWGETVRRFFEVGRCGYWVASNLHALSLIHISEPTRP